MYISLYLYFIFTAYCLLIAPGLSVTYLPPRGATVHALNRKSEKTEEFPVPFYRVSLGYTVVTRGAGHMLSEKSQRTQNGTMFVDLD